MKVKLECAIRIRPATRSCFSHIGSRIAAYAMTIAYINQERYAKRLEYDTRHIKTQKEFAKI